MTIDVFTALLAYAFVMSITPGPNNVMLVASGANFGFRRTLPHMMGIGAGVVVMLLLVGFGLIQVFERIPASYQILKIVSVLYLLWLAWRITRASAPDGSEMSGQPMSFMQAALFQWVNPKAWSMGLTAITLYAPERSLIAVLVVAAVFGAVNLPCVSSWTFLGQQMRRLLQRPGLLTAFNWSMAALLLASLYPVLVTG